MDHSGPFLFSELFCGTPPSCLKVIRGVGLVGWVVAPKIIASAPVPFGPLLGPFRAGTGLDWVGIGSGGIGDSGVGD